MTIKTKPPLDQTSICNLQFAICNLQSFTIDRKGPRRGFVLILVVVVIALLMLVGFTFSELMLTERKAAILSGRQAQALAAAESGLQMSRIFLLKDKDTQDQAGGWYDNASVFRGMLVVNDNSPSSRARFTIVAPLLENGIPVGGIRFGLENESCRLNLNILLQNDKSNKNSSPAENSADSASQAGNSSAASSAGAASSADSASSSASSGARGILMNLPGMTEEIADAILDWIDADDQPRQYGAESEYYSTLNPPYQPKNGPLDTVEELLLVRGVNPWLLFGCDVNRNGRIDADEPSTVNLPGVDNSDGSMNQGWVQYLTLYSKEKNIKSDGTAKINLNQSDMQKLNTELQTVLSPEQAAFIVAYRQYGPYSGTQTGTTTISANNLDLSKQGSSNISSILDLIGAKVQIQLQGQRQPTVYESPFTNTPSDMNAYLPILLDNTAVNTAKEIVGRVNINQAPKAVLMCIPSITEDIADEIIARRTMDPKGADASILHETWLLSEGVVTLKQMKALMPYVTCGGDVYRIQAVGYFEDGGVAARIEAIIDASTQPATVLFWRDISHLGRGFSLEELGVGSVL